MSESSPDLPGVAERPPVTDEHLLPILAIGKADSTDNTPTVISKNLPRLMNNDEALNGIRGRKLAHFELIDRIGVGGMAAVLRARDTQLDRIVALKILPPDMAIDQENISRFHQEARSAAKLDHENIARVFFCGEDQRLHFIAFEFVEGENLRTILEQRGRVPVGEALHYMIQIAAGLAHASERGVVHRDIKPSNIIITPTGRAKLVDMGLARSMEPQHDIGLTQSGVTLGTFDYISPEQALEPREADVRSDIYSLGCTFYHMLTGSPPVPEGTAARKLHHHQHVKPRDPREIVPGLPDDVAVILDRMLAKEPGDRYQTPQHLVHHLLQAARKVGVVSDVPEGVLAMEAVVPAAPRHRALLVAALTTVAVVVLILFLGQGNSNPVPDVMVNGNNPTVKPVNDKGAVLPGDNNHATPVNPPVVVNPPELKTLAHYDSEDGAAADLTKWLKDNAKAEELDIVLSRDLDLPVSGREEANDLRLIFKAKKVTIRAKDPTRPVTIRLTYTSHGSATRPSFVVDSKEATLEGLCFLIDARETDVEMIGLLCAGGGDYRINQCLFVQANPPKEQKADLASLVVDSAAATGRTRVVLHECCFLGFGRLPNEPSQPDVLQLHNAEYGGHEAVVRRGPAQIEAINCAFGPHTSIFRLEGKAAANEEILVRHCSVLAGRRSAVFSVADDAGDALTVENSLFSQPSDSDAEHDRALLLRQGDRRVVPYEDRDNRYHNIDTSWIGVEIPREPSRRMDVNPWKEEQPLKRLELLAFADPAAKPSATDNPLSQQRQKQIAAAFQVNWQDHLADLQPAKEPLHLIGVEHLPTMNYIASLPKDSAGPLGRKERVVDPKEKMSHDGVYPTLRAAVGDAKPGEKILIKYTGEMAIGPIRLEEAGADLTICPYPDYHPILTLESSPEADAFLFRVYDGKLQLENLEFRVLAPSQEYKTLAVTALLGNGQCTFKNCVVTLDPGKFDAQLAVAAIADPGVIMMKPKPTSLRTLPRLEFKDCVMRGQGDMICDRASRPFELEARNVLAVLAGNVLNLEYNAEPANATPLVNATMTNVTAYQTGYVLLLRDGKDLKTLPTLHCAADHCLFVAAGARALIIHLEGLDATEEKLKDKGWWTGDSNAYVNFGNMLDQRPHGEDMPQPAIMSDKWKAFTGEMSSKVLRAVKFATPPGPDGPFTRVGPSHFKTAELSGCGADLTTLPKPAQVSSDMEE